MGTKKAKIGIGVRFSKDMMDDLRQVCKLDGVSKAEVIRAGTEREIRRRIRSRLKETQ